MYRVAVNERLYRKVGSRRRPPIPPTGEDTYMGGMEPEPDHPSVRKLVAITLILLLILIWAALVASLSRWVGQFPILVQAIFYLIMGVAWIAPLKPLIRWSQSRPSKRSQPGHD